MKSKIAISLLALITLTSCADSNTVKQEDYEQVNQNLTDSSQEDVKSFKNAEIDKNTNYEATEVQDEVNPITGSGDTATNTNFSISGATVSQTGENIR